MREIRGPRTSTRVCLLALATAIIIALASGKSVPMRLARACECCHSALSLLLSVGMTGLRLMQFGS